MLIQIVDRMFASGHIDVRDFTPMADVNLLVTTQLIEVYYGDMKRLGKPRMMSLLIFV